MITPRAIRRALLRAVPLPILLAAGGVFLSLGAGSTVAIALLGVTPALALIPELVVAKKAPGRSVWNEVALALGSWLLIAVGLLLLTAQGVYLDAMLSRVDPAGAVRAALRLPKPVVLVAIGFAALPFAAVATLLASVHLDGLDRLPGYGLWALAAVWGALAVPAAILASPPPGTPGYFVPLLVTIGLIPVMAVAASIVTLVTIGADALELRIWPEAD